MSGSTPCPIAYYRVGGTLIFLCYFPPFYSPGFKILKKNQVFLKKVLDFCGGLWFNLLMKFETGTQVQHRDNPNWKAVVVRDTNPRKPVNGLVLVNHNGRESLMPKTVVRVSFHLDAKKEFGEFVR